MERFAILLILMASVVFLKAQDRVDKVLPKISRSTLSVLDHATGWMKGEDDIWISRKNRITVYEPSTSILLDYSENKPGTHNFNRYEFRKVNYKGQQYVLFAKSSTYGAYQYPAIKKEWFDIPNYFGYFIEPSELSKFDSLSDGEINIIKIKYISGVGAGHAKTIEEQLSNLEKGFNEEAKTYNELIFHIWPIKDKGIVQFNIYFAAPDEYGDDLKWKIDGFYKEYVLDPSTNKLVERLRSSLIKDRQEIYMNDRLFDWFYYEVDYPSFMGFVNVKLD